MKLSIVFLFFACLNVATSIKIDCVFTVTFDGLYSCTNHNLGIEENAVDITGVKGHHLAEKQNDDVMAIYFLSAGMKRLPRNVFNIFKNLDKYIVHGLDTVMDYLDSEALVRGDFSNANSLNSLYFTSVVLEQLRASVFEGAENLTYITLEACHITMIHKEAFKGLNKLESLGLKYNYLTTLEVETFSDLVGLQDLLLSGNFIRTITKDHLKSMRRLNRLAMIGNLLTDVDQNIVDGLKELEFLYLDQNVCIDEHFGTDGVSFSKFKKLIMSCSKDESIDANLRKKEHEIRLLEEEVATLQRLVQKYRKGNCGPQMFNVKSGKDVSMKIKEMP